VTDRERRAVRRMKRAREVHLATKAARRRAAMRRCLDRQRAADAEQRLREGVG